MTERSPEERQKFRDEVLGRQRAKREAAEASQLCESGDNGAPDLSDPSMLVEFGDALWGPRWMSSAAQHLGVSTRTVRRWAKGEAGEPEAQDMEWLRLEARARIKRLQALLDGEAQPSVVREYLMQSGSRS